MKKVVMIIFAFIAIFLGAFLNVYAFIFFDDFNGSSLDTAQWKILSGGSNIWVTGSFLELAYGGSLHKRIESVPRFTYGTLEAYLKFDDDYQKFGFGVNGDEDSDIDMGFFFDTLTSGYRTPTGKLSWRVYKGGTSYEQHLIDNTAFNVWYTVKINWLPGVVNFYVDGNKVGEYLTSYSDPLPIRIYNDRGGNFLIDQVAYTAIPEPATLLLFGSSLFGLLVFRRRRLWGRR